MPLRSQTYIHIAPSSSRDAFTQLSSSCPTNASAQSQHQTHPSNYKDNQARTAAISRLALLRMAWSGNNNSESHSRHNRRLSAVLEEGAQGRHDDDGYDDAHKGRRRRRSFTVLLLGSYSHLLRRRTRRFIVYAFGIFFLYLTVFRLILNSTFHADLPAAGAASSGLKSKPTSRTLRDPPPRANLAGARARDHRPRAPLPPRLLSKRTRDHRVEGGLLKVNPESLVHPIYQLIRDARDEWDQKVARQSKTLKQAVAEYRRRYGRQPPKGFDKWWAYVCEHDVPLPDEYDQIHHDLLPFRALSPRDLNSRIDVASLLPDSYTLKVKRGSIRTLSTYDSQAIEGANERLEGQAALLRPIAQWLGDITVVYSVHDTATAVVGYDHKRELLEHVEEGEWFDEDDEIDMTLEGWAAACPFSSPIRIYSPLTSPPSILPNTSITHKSFISSHSSTMDLCSNPSLISLHGALAGKSPKVQPLTPIFSLSKTKLHSDVLGVPVEQWIDTKHLTDISWEDKTEDRLMWRGSNTGAYHSTETPWRISHRTRLLKMANMASSEHDLAEPHTNSGWDGVEARFGNEAGGPDFVEMLPSPRNMRSQQLKKGIQRHGWSEVNERYMDLAFTGSPLQCDVQDGTCEDLAYEFTWADPMTHEDALKYRYIVDVDGNAWSARFKRLLSSGSLIFKSSIMPEWWTDRIQPWVHYVPVQMDYSDLYDILGFFQGDLSFSGSELPLAREIATSGKEWASTHWRKEDMTAYVFRLYLEWGRLMAERRGDMDLVYEESMDWGNGSDRGHEHEEEEL
ncbi:hypothetical protein IAR55_004265 [Kwoniella newhampshirensis]|uniref:Glycosyl transferase CAP10 domain-containing protein n=1 Tax=Kwoniella newhampshirensis TaxID=1651941 RepID=A0AAW0YXI2_9TREE